MKILQVTQFFKPSWESGGVTRAAYEISRRLQMAGHDVTIYTTNRNKYPTGLPTNRPLNVDGMKVYYFENLRKYFPGAALPIVPYYLPFVAHRDLRNYDIIHIHEHRTLLAAMVSYYAREYGIPYVLQPHGSLPKDRALGKAKMKNLFDFISGSAILDAASRLIVMNSIEKEQIRMMGTREDKIAVIPNGISLERCATTRSKGEFRKFCGIENGSSLILYLGRLARIKGIDFLIEAFSRLVQEEKDAVLVIAGPEWNYKRELEEKVRTLGIQDRVRFVGYLDDVGFAYQDADLLVYPGMYEIFGLVPFEAIMSGTPVIVTDSNGSGELIRKGNCGLAVQYGDCAELAEKMAFCLENPGEGRKMVRRGQEFVRENLTWNRVVDRLEQEYRRCL
ncbi:glycosyltransferase family 4 protein [Methanoculleus horonobensis]|jgi:glycosyltransferase involved in cell wall biosynthesis|uniref:glycosyltransferase family 4 protein n=1 Tax=Methanoculleus horonobensis TaxID=528314 RepID=UPI000829585D|nr:glycosyltransferase family 4 protein [Methanoculleus horonobensis]